MYEAAVDSLSNTSVARSHGTYQGPRPSAYSTSTGSARSPKHAVFKTPARPQLTIKVWKRSPDPRARSSNPRRFQSSQGQIFRTLVSPALTTISPPRRLARHSTRTTRENLELITGLL